MLWAGESGEGEKMRLDGATKKPSRFFGGGDGI